MTKYDQLKAEIASIAEIANSVPETFRERCFEVLLQNLLASTSTEQKPPVSPKNDPPTDDPPAKPAGATGAAIPTPSQIKVFLQKTGVTVDELARVVMYDDDAVHFILEPKTTKIARGQVEWSLLSALKSGIESNVLAADPEKIRSICQDKGFYDKANFLKNFKSTTTAGYFSAAMEAQGEAQKLTTEGMKELAKVIRDLAAAA